MKKYFPPNLLKLSKKNENFWHLSHNLLPAKQEGGSTPSGVAKPGLPVSPTPGKELQHPFGRTNCQHVLSLPAAEAEFQVSGPERV